MRVDGPAGCGASCRRLLEGAGRSIPIHGIPGVRYQAVGNRRGLGAGKNAAGHVVCVQCHLSHTVGASGGRVSIKKLAGGGSWDRAQVSSKVKMSDQRAAHTAIRDKVFFRAMVVVSEADAVRTVGCGT
jgi:hypothetical protein